jgi:hypothetical protein
MIERWNWEQAARPAPSFSDKMLATDMEFSAVIARER